MDWKNDFKESVLKTYELNKSKIENQYSFDGDKEYYKSVKKYNKDLVLILIGGVAQTLFFGISGFFILLYRKKREVNVFNNLDWLYIFITFFLSREVFVFVLNIFEFIRNNRLFGDEVRIAKHFGLYDGSFIIPLGVLCFLTLSWVVLYYIPKKFLLEFIIAGFFGFIFRLLFME